MRKKLIIGLCLLFVIEVAAGTAIILNRKAQAEEFFDNLIAEFEQTELHRLKMSETSDQEIDEIIELSGIYKDDERSFSSRKPEFDQALSRLDELSDKIDDYCSGYLDNEFDASEIPDGGRYFLLPTDKQGILSDLKAVLAERDQLSTSCETKAVVIGFNRVNILTEKVNQAFNELKDSGEFLDREVLDVLKPFSNGGFEIPDEDSLRETLGDNYIDSTQQTLNWFGQYYDAVIAYNAGFSQLAQQKLLDLNDQYLGIVIKRQKTDAELSELVSAMSEKRMKVAEKLLPIVDAIDKSGTSLDKNLWTLSYILNSIDTVSNKNRPDRSQLAADNVDELLDKLQDMEYLTHRDATDTTGITYRSDGDGSRELSYEFDGNKLEF